MAGRPRRPLWKRPYTSYRLGERKRPDVGDEPQRLSLFVSGHMLDLADELAMRAGAVSVQVYCEELLVGALQAEQSRHQIEATEARHGRLEGYRAIADDPEYLAELSASVAHRDDRAPRSIASDDATGITFTTELQPPMALPVPRISEAMATVVRHAGLDREESNGFLASLRRGEAPSEAAVEELGTALVDLDSELRGRSEIDRRLAHALHRLAIESQVLHTDAWPGAFDGWTLDAVRAVQAAVERLLSGEATSY